MCWNWLVKMARNARDFLFNSDYAQDQIVYFKEVVFKNKTNLYFEKIPHGLDFTPLVFGVWDNDDTYKNPKSVNALGKNTYRDIDGDIAYSNQVFVYANSTEIIVFVQPEVDNNLSPVPTNFHIRLYAFEPPDSHSAIKPTSKYAGKFIFNTKYNYLKLKQQGTIEADVSTVSITHALGYVPQVLAWAEVNNSGHLGYVDSYIPPWLNYRQTPLKVTKNIVYFERFNNQPTKYYYRIYYDEA